MKKALIIVLTLVLAASMLMFAGCKKAKKLPADKMMTAALSRTLDTVETKLAADEARQMLKNGLFTFSIEIENPEDPTQKVGINAFLKNHKFAFKMDGMEKAIGIDLGAFRDNFPKSMFGTKGDNMMGLDTDSEKQIIEIVEQLVKEQDIDFSEDITKFVKEHGTMNAEYSVKSKVGGEDKIVNKLSVSFNKKQLEAAGKDIMKELKNSPLAAMFPMDMPDDDDIDIGDEYSDTDEMLKLELFTDVISHEILAGEFRMLTKDYEGSSQYETIKLDTVKTGDSIKYNIDAHIDEEDVKLSAFIQDNDKVKQFKFTADGSELFSLSADKAAKKFKMFFGGATEGLEFDYDITRDAKGNVTYFKASLDLAKLGEFFEAFERMMPGVYADDYYFMEGGLGSSYDDDWDDSDWDDDDWDDDDYGFGLDIAGKITVTYSAEGDVPAFEELLKMSSEEFQNIFAALFGQMVPEEY